MGQCFSHLTNKHGSSSDEELPRSVPTHREHQDDSTEVDRESAEARNGEEPDSDDIGNAILQAKRQTIDIESIKYEIFNKLKDKKVGAEGNQIILPDDVSSIWNLSYYRRFYRRQVWYDAEWDKTGFMDQFVQIMSILICINFSDWDQFGAVFIDRRDRRDGDLPFDQKVLQQEGFLRGVTGQKFYEEQFAFCPIRIPQQEDDFILDAQKRLPWIDKPEIIGHGAYGVVTKQTVAKGFLHYQGATVNASAKLVAVKTVSSDDIKPDELRNEINNLKELRACLSDHERIMVNIVTMIEKSSQKDIYHVVYELAAYDLNVFLTNMPRKLRDKRHATANRERTDSASMWPGDLISESVNLADALDYLHNRLYTKSHTSLKSYVSLSHNDIKPENILVVYPETTNQHDRFPVGQWKLTDFGLSFVKQKRSHLSADNDALSPSRPQKTHRTERPRSVSKAMPARYPGLYTAPELDQMTPRLEDCRQADVWSFGCVLSEIVTYAVKLDCRLVEDFRASLGQRFYNDDELKDVKPQFLNHLADLPNTSHGAKIHSEKSQWIGSCANLIKEIVVKEPARRPDAGKIRAELSRIDLSMRDEKKEWLSHHPKLDLSNMDADTAVSGQVSAVSQSPTEYSDSDRAGGNILSAVPSFCFHHVEHSGPETIRPPYGGEDGRRASAPR